MGPVLFFRGQDAEGWQLSALIASAETGKPGPLVTSTAHVLPQRLASRGGHVVWRYDFAFPMEQSPCSRQYRIGERSWTVHLPGPEERLRIAFTACNGNERGDTWKDGNTRNALWLHLAEEHAREAFHLLLQGGDQLYADPIWRKVPALSEWRWLPWRKRRAAPFTPEMAEAVADFYFESYRRLWEQPQLAPVLASVPSLMMWDDHDILDGWGSYGVELKDCLVLQGIWSAAREHFALFQLATQPDELPEGFMAQNGQHFGWAYRIGEIGLIAPDLRSERSRRQVMGEAGWRAFTTALDGLAGCRHVVLISTVLLVNAQRACAGQTRRTFLRTRTSEPLLAGLVTD